jgi:ABC-type multidrug transport system fused ATPase/permease subunit
MHPNVLPQILCRVWRHINMRRRIQFGLLFLLMVLTSFAEVISIGAVLPFLGVLTAPERIFDHAAAQPLIQLLNLTESKQLLLPLTIIFAAAVLVAGLMRIILLFGQTRLSYSIGADLSYDIYYRTLYQPYAVHVARNSSAVISGISQKANTVVGSVISPVITILSSILMLLSILGVLLSIDTMVAVVAFVGFGLIYVIVIFGTKKSVARDSLRINHESTQVIKALQEGLGGIRDVLIDGTQAVYCN